MKKTTFIIVLSFLFAGVLSAADTLISVSDADETNCPDGGARIDVGEDTNGNGTLDDDEIDENKAEYVCNGSNGATGISISDAGTMCGEGGGIKVTVSSSSGSSSSYVCNGTDGKNALSRTSIEDAGNNCPNGGIKIEVGLDEDKDGLLDDGEVAENQTKYACNGGKGADGHDALTKVSDEPKGSNCKNSNGVKIETGLDSNDNGVLDTDEVTGTQYICNGKNGPQGQQGEKGDQGAPGVNGTDGKDGDQGEKGDQGPKGDQGEQGETGATGEAGKNGSTSLVSVVDEPAGENCAAGGKKIEVGLDVNGNGALDEDEIDTESIYYVCNGRDAEEAGLTSSSTGCSLSAVDEDDSIMMFVLAIISVVCAFAAVRFVRS